MINWKYMLRYYMYISTLLKGGGDVCVFKGILMMLTVIWMVICFLTPTRKLS